MTYEEVVNYIGSNQYYRSERSFLLDCEAYANFKGVKNKNIILKSFSKSIIEGGSFLDRFDRFVSIVEICLEYEKILNGLASQFETFGKNALAELNSGGCLGRLDLSLGKHAAYVGCANACKYPDVALKGSL